MLTATNEFYLLFESFFYFSFSLDFGVFVVFVLLLFVSIYEHHATNLVHTPLIIYKNTPDLIDDKKNRKNIFKAIKTK